MNELNTFSNFSELKIAGISVLSGVQKAFCGMKCVNLNNETLKIFGVHFRKIKVLRKIKTFANIL